MGALSVKRAREKEEVPKVAAKEEERKAQESRSQSHRPRCLSVRVWRRFLKGR